MEFCRKRRRTKYFKYKRNKRIFKYKPPIRDSILQLDNLKSKIIDSFYTKDHTASFKRILAVNSKSIKQINPITKEQVLLIP